jgi:hypothetical protein
MSSERIRELSLGDGAGMEFGWMDWGKNWRRLKKNFAKFEVSFEPNLTSTSVFHPSLDSRSQPLNQSLEQTPLNIQSLNF